MPCDRFLQLYALLCPKVQMTTCFVMLSCYIGFANELLHYTYTCCGLCWSVVMFGVCATINPLLGQWCCSILLHCQSHLTYYTITIIQEYLSITVTIILFPQYVYYITITITLFPVIFTITYYYYPKSADYEQRYWHYYEAHNAGYCLQTLYSGKTTPCASSCPFCTVLMYFRLGRVRMYMDFCVWCNNYGILATNVNPVTVPLWHRY